jgi:hypothetical protein
MGLGVGVGCSTKLSAVAEDVELLLDGPPAAIRGAGIETPLRPMAARVRAMMVR